MKISSVTNDAEYQATVAEAIRLAGVPDGTREAERLAEAIQAAEGYEARRGWRIDDELRLSSGLARFRATIRA